MIKGELKIDIGDGKEYRKTFAVSDCEMKVGINNCEMLKYQIQKAVQQIFCEIFPLKVN